MSQNVAVIEAARLPYPDAAARMGVESSAWQTLVNATFPTARTAEGVLLALNYCRARKLDVFKRPVHIVPIRTKIKNADGKEYWVDLETVWPGINELRTTAHRTGVYAGSDPAEWGPDITSEWELPSGGDDNGDDHPNAPPREKKAEAAPVKMLKVVHPEWCQITVYRLVQGQRIAFPGPRVYWLETYATAGKSDRPNEMWKDRSRGQLEKCAEAAALRKAFPEELGGEHIVEEAPRMVEINPAGAAPESRPDRTEIEAKPKAKGGAKAIEASKVDRSAPIQSKAADNVVVTVDAGETSGPAKAETAKPAELGEALEHALKVLDKLTVDEIVGARASVRKELSADDFAVWNTRSFERERELRGRR